MGEKGLSVTVMKTVRMMGVMGLCVGRALMVLGRNYESMGMQ